MEQSCNCIVKTKSPNLYLLPSNIDALVEKEINNLKGKIIRINNVQIFAMDDSKFVNSNTIDIISDYSIPMWQATCKLYNKDAERFLKKARGKSLVEIEMVGEVVSYRRSTPKSCALCCRSINNFFRPIPQNP